MQEVSCRVSSTIIEYVHRTRPEAITSLLKGIPHSADYLLNTDNWIPWEVERSLEVRAALIYNNPLIMFEVGKSILTHQSLGMVNVLINLFQQPEELIRYSPKIAKYFTKGLVQFTVLETTSESATVKVRVNGRQSRGACLYNQGMFSVITELFGYQAAEVHEVQCVVPAGDAVGTLKLQDRSQVKFGAESCVFKLNWSRTEKGPTKQRAGKAKALDDAMQQLEDNYAKLQSAYGTIRRSEERYRSLMENAGDLIYILDPEGIVTTTNKKGLELTEYSLDEIVGHQFIDFIDPLDRQNVSNLVQKAMHKKLNTFETKLVSKDNDSIVVSINMSQIRLGEEAIGLMLIARDISKEREIAAQLIEAERFAAKGIIAAEIAHEINNSLANIETDLYITDNKKIAPQLREEAKNNVRDEINRMAGIVTGILEVYGAGNSSIQHVSVNEEIMAVVKFVSRRFKGKGINLITKLCEESPMITCSPGHLKQILLNLLKNAADAVATSPGKAIIVSTTTNECFTTITVQDTGCGIPIDIINDVTSKLFTTKPYGVGLGLSICQQLIEKYGGFLTINSKLEKGTTIAVMFQRECNV